MPESFRFELRAGIGLLTLCRPPQNRLDHAFFGEFRDFSRTVLADAGLRGLVLTGEGKHFSSGADVAELSGLLRGRERRPDFLADNARSFAALESAAYPVVAAVAGCCLGAGLELALACRYRIAADSAMLGFPEAGFGLIPGCGGSVRAGAAFGPGAAARLVLGGGNLLAAEALAAGLVHAVVPRRGLLEAAMAAAERLAAAN